MVCMNQRFGSFIKRPDKQNMQAGAVFNSQEEGRKESSQASGPSWAGKRTPPTTGFDLETFRTAGSAKGLLCLLWANHFMRAMPGSTTSDEFPPLYSTFYLNVLRASTPLQASRKAAFGSQRQCAMLPGALGRLWGWYEIGKQMFRKHQTIEALRRRDLLCCSLKI